MSRGGNGLGRAQARLETAKEGAQGAVTVMETLRGQAQRRGGAVGAGADFAREDLAARGDLGASQRQDDQVRTRHPQDMRLTAELPADRR